MLISFLLSLMGCFSCDTEPMETFSHNGVDRQYILHLPASYDGTKKLPLMLSFHGFGGTASGFQSWTGMTSVADAENFIVVFPQGAKLNLMPHWNAGLPSPENKSTSEDFGFINALLDELSSTYQVDAARIYASGYSNGAFFTYALACYHGDRFAAIASVAGTMMEETYQNCKPTHPTPLINLHGTADETVPYDGGEELRSVADVVAYWNKNNGNGSEAAVALSQDKIIEKHVYSGGSRGASVVHYKVKKGGHVWFEQKYDGATTSRLIWDFVSKYDRTGLRKEP